MIPLPVILVEFLAAFGLALLAGNGLALLRLRRDGGPAVRPLSRTRIFGGMAAGLLVTLWAIASWIGNGYRL